MYQKFARALKKLHRGQRGMTGLETAIILIAFVTVASVLAYSVLSAGIFSAERGKATVYSGLEQAQATMEIKGSILGTSDNTNLQTIIFWVGLVMPDEEVDMSALVFTYYDNFYHEQFSSSDWTSALDNGSTERGSSGMLENDEIHKITVTMPQGSSNVTAYEWMTLQLIPPTGATITIKRTMPGQLKPVMDLQ